MKPVIFIAIALVSLIPIPVFAQEMGYVQNEFYDYSFELPISWKFLEDSVTADGNTIHTLMWPDGFNPYLLPATPAIRIVFENLLVSDVSSLYNVAIEIYHVDSVLTETPNARIISTNVQTESWGWKSTIEASFVITGQEYLGVETLHVFKDRETYNVVYLANEEDYFDVYYPVYENVLETLVIKSVAVPEFGSIALLILTSSIVSIIIISRRFGVMS